MNNSLTKNFPARHFSHLSFHSSGSTSAGGQQVKVVLVEEKLKDAGSVGWWGEYGALQRTEYDM